MPNLLVLHTKPRPSFSCPSFNNISSVFCLFSYEKSVGLLSLLLFWLVCLGHVSIIDYPQLFHNISTEVPFLTPTRHSSILV